jgi:Glycosyltransferase family 10 (fucosyltransferase) C-term/Fucosyltransferase, N-terminal
MWDQPVDQDRATLPASCCITDDAKNIGDAAAVVFHIPSLRMLPTLKPPGQLWVAWSMESEVNYPRLRDPSFMSPFDLTMTYRLDADVPLAYTSYYDNVANLARALRTPPRPKSGDKLASLFISSGLNRSGRIEYATELMRYLDIHSYGQALQNREIPLPDRGRPSKLDMLAYYRFDLSFENSCSEDYVTEKFFDPLVAGTVPVYLGAPNVDRFAPGDHCFINTSDFQNPKDLADYLRDLDRDETAYAAYHSWRERPFRPSFDRLLEGQETPPFARLCHEITTRQREKR